MRDVNVVTAFKDLFGILLLVALLPLWMAVGLGAVVVIVTRQLLWWARGNTTSVSRSTALVMSPRPSRTSRATQVALDPPDPLEPKGPPTLTGAPAALRPQLALAPGTGFPNEVLR